VHTKAADEPDYAGGENRSGGQREVLVVSPVPALKEEPEPANIN